MMGAGLLALTSNNRWRNTNRRKEVGVNLKLHEEKLYGVP